jgi:PadR family transcriptional regulator, regulatory protein AphA
MEPQESYPITYAILGLLALGGPQSGYDLKRLFDHLLSAMWSAAQSQIYKELRRMQTLGWVEMQRVEQVNRPDRKLYSLTPAGVVALQNWQKQPPTVLHLRDELLLKLLFGAFAAPGDLLPHLRAGIAEHELRLLAYRQNLLLLPPRGAWPTEGQRPNPYLAEAEEADPYLRLVTRFAIAFEQMYLRWLHDALAELTGDAEPQPEQAQDNIAHD